MNIKPFAVEEWMNAYEDGARYNIAETCVDSVSLDELFALCGEDRQAFLEHFCARRLTYGDIVGSEALREGVCGLYQSLTPSEVVPTHGAAGANYHVFCSLVSPGDGVVSIMPAYQQMYSIPEAIGADVRLMHLRQENGYLPDLAELKALVTPETKMICLNNPNNPTGGVMDAADLEAIAEVLRGTNIMVLSDEIYAELTYGLERHISIATLPGMKERTIVVNGFSKAYAMTGWRIGFAAGPEWVIKACNKLQGQYTSGPCSVSQKAAEAAYTGPQDEVEKMRQAFERRRDLIVKLAKEVPGFEVNVPQAAIYLFPKCDFYFGKEADGRKIENAADLAMYLLEVAHVACVGGGAFGAPECIRMSYATSDENIVEAMRRIKEALAKLK